MAKVSSITNRAGKILKDANHVRWTAAELLLWYNDAVRDTVQFDTAANAKHATPILIAGARQSLPPDAVALIDVIGNINTDGSQGAQIFMCERKALDAFMPKWQSTSQKTVIQNAMYDPKDRKTFYVYPPVAAGTKIELVHSYLPNEATDANSDDIALDPQYFTPLLDYVLWRAFSKDSENPASKARAESHSSAYQSAISAIINIRNGISPTQE